MMPLKLVWSVVKYFKKRLGCIEERIFNYLYMDQPSRGVLCWKNGKKKQKMKMVFTFFNCGEVLARAGARLSSFFLLLFIFTTASTMRASRYRLTLAQLSLSLSRRDMSGS
jgi:hypothetical protein